jgi:alpha-tubulin suppressor-like RCC1 family protein
MRPRSSRTALLPVAALAAAASVACGSAPTSSDELTASTTAALKPVKGPGVTSCPWFETLVCGGNDVPWQPECYCVLNDKPVITELALGAATGYALDASGDVYTWGSGAHYARGDGATRDASSLQQPFVYDATHVTAGDTGGAASTSNGTLVAWGTVAPGVDWAWPAAIDGIKVDATKPSQLAHGASHTCAIAQWPDGAPGGQAYCWGANDQAQLGDGTTTSRATVAPVATMGSCDGIPGPVPPFTALAAGGATTCALAVDGNVWCWGDNTHGALGQGTESPGTSSTTPLCVHPTFSSSPAATWIRGGGSGTFCIGTDSVSEHMECWGDNAQGQLGDGVPLRRDVPTEALKTMLDAPLLAFGASHTCYGGASPALSATASTTCFGDDTFGQLGDGTTSTSPRFSPVSPQSDQFAVIAAGGTFTCGVPTHGGFLACWGKDDHGQVPDGVAIVPNGVRTAPKDAIWNK